MATMKSEFLSHYQAQHGVPLRSRLFGGDPARSTGSAPPPRRCPTCPVPRGAARARSPASTAGGRSRASPARRCCAGTASARRDAGARGDVVFLADSFTTFTEPAIGRAAIELLEAAGWNVRLESAGCCGRSSISKGLLDQARGMAAAMVDRLAPEAERGVPIVGCEPSCLLTLREEHPACCPTTRARSASPTPRGSSRSCSSRRSTTARSRLDPERRRQPAARSSSTATATRRRSPAPRATVALLERIPGAQVTELDAGCCGMAGSFGFETEHYDLSMQIGESRLFPALRGAAPGTLVSATGVSCRQQIGHGVGQRAWHPVELVRAAQAA